MSPEKNYFDRLKSSPDDLRESVKIFAREDERTDKQDRRRCARFKYATRKPIKVDIEHVGGTTSHLLVRPYDLSDHGIGFFHGGFVFPHSKCELELISHDNEQIGASGQVVRCLAIRGQVHFCGVEFDHEINARLILGIDEDADAERSIDNVEATPVSTGDVIDQLSRHLRALADAPSLFVDCASMVQDLDRLRHGEQTKLPLHYYLTSDSIAVLDQAGKVVMVNPAWCMFALENGYSGAGFTGMNYLDKCKQTSDKGKLDSELPESLEQVLKADKDQFTWYYTCHAPRLERWFEMHVERDREIPDGVVVRHRLVGTREASTT